MSAQRNPNIPQTQHSGTNTLMPYYGKTAHETESARVDTTPYTATFTIPCEWWSGTDTQQTERTRAKRRRWVRSYAKAEWRSLKQRGEAHHCERFVAVIGVAYPRMNNVTPSAAAETVKPIIDGGSDAKLWPDDDAHHRCATIYFQLPDPAPVNYYRLQVFIFPVPARNPIYQPVGEISEALHGAWAKIPEQERPTGYDGYSIRANIPHKLWITSNLTDSDLLARQRGAQKARTWGTMRSFGAREKIGAKLREQVSAQWRKQNYWGVERFIILAGVSYPFSVEKDQADPDNAAETVNEIMKVGAMQGIRAWRDTSSANCKAVGFFRWPYDCPPGQHAIHLLVLPVPDEGFHILDAMADSWQKAWTAYERRRS